MIKKLKLKNLFIIIEIVLFIIFFLFMPAQVNATNNEVLQTNPSVKAETSIIGDLGEDLRKRSTPGDAGNIVYQIMENTFYIKNAYSGRYMDVYRGIVADGTNVQQCGFNGGDNQKWYINYNGDGTFSILSQINSNYALDVYGASGDNYANIGIWSHHDGDAQKFKIFYTDTSTYIIKTKISNYEKAVVVHANGCSDEDNINQYTYSNNWNELWILEPVTRNIELGVKYAIDNAENKSSVFVYPRYTDNAGDCTNFASQFLLASGIHYQDDWYIYRKNGAFHNNISNNIQVKYSWDLSDTWCWPVAQNFRDFWSGRSYKYYMAKGSAIAGNPEGVWNLSIPRGTIVQIADYDNGLKNSWHTMIITGYTTDSNGYILTYHTNDTLSKTLSEVASTYPDSYFVFLEL